MLTQNKIKFIKSLDKKKYRTIHSCFVIEGEKMINELIINNNYNILELFSTDNHLINNLNNLKASKISEKELAKISSLKTPNKSLAIVEIPDNKNIDQNDFDDLSLALDNIQDPGNLGTIIRTASWFGIKNIFCSEDTVDVYNSKVIQSTMGAIFKVNVVYNDLIQVIKKAKENNQWVYGTKLDGENIYSTKLTKGGLIVMGNESKGISNKVAKEIDKGILIPNYPVNERKMESLNVSVACALTCAEFRRRLLLAN